MGWSWKIANIRGIDVKVHATFVLALIWGALIWGGGRPQGWAYGAFLTLVLFAIVLAHEFGHAIAAQRYGVKVQDIVLLPIGGLARLDRMPEKPSQELVVAIAGPAVNVVLALLAAPVLAAVMLAKGLSFPVGFPPVTHPGLLNLVGFLVVINVSLLLFNLVPAFPMDGGRVLRALLALKLRYTTATIIAVYVGRVFAALFGVLAFMTGNLSLALVAVFVFFGAGSELQEATSRESLAGLKVGEVIDSTAPVFSANLPAFTAFERLVRMPYKAVAVVDDDGRFMGIVTRQGMQSRWSMGLRGNVEAFVEMVRPVQVECDAPLASARDLMAEARSPLAAVYCGSSFEGLLDFDTIARIIAMRQMGWRTNRGPVTSHG